MVRYTSAPDCMLTQFPPLYMHATTNAAHSRQRMTSRRFAFGIMCLQTMSQAHAPAAAMTVVPFCSIVLLPAPRLHTPLRPTMSYLVQGSGGMSIGGDLADRSASRESSVLSRWTWRGGL